MVLKSFPAIHPAPGRKRTHVASLMHKAVKSYLIVLNCVWWNAAVMNTVVTWLLMLHLLGGIVADYGGS